MPSDVAQSELSTCGFSERKPCRGLSGAPSSPSGNAFGADFQASGDSPRVCVLVGSPRANGSSAALARCVARGVGRAGCTADLVLLADFAVAGCTGCGACECRGACALDPCERRAAAAGGLPGFASLLERLEEADALALVAPVYFSGPPSQLKAVLDRMQPLWAQRYLLKSRPPVPKEKRRPFDLLVVGNGGDPFGYDALVSCARSSLRMADFELRELHDFVADAAGRDAAWERRGEEAGFGLARSLRPGGWNTGLRI